VGELKPGHVAAAAALAVAGVLAWTAARSGRVDVPKTFTELQGPVLSFQEHLAHAGELLTEPVTLPHRYPPQTAPGTTQTIHQGFTPLYQLPDPQIAALPAAEPW